jgi:hypothetical protein
MAIDREGAQPGFSGGSLPLEQLPGTQPAVADLALYLHVR